ncbi:hypothetical protein BKA57DRAFT_471415, partial [Linnemannia elongata]
MKKEEGRRKRKRRRQKQHHSVHLHLQDVEGDTYLSILDWGVYVCVKMTKKTCHSTTASVGTLGNWSNTTCSLFFYVHVTLLLPLQERERERERVPSPNLQCSPRLCVVEVIRHLTVLSLEYTKQPPTQRPTHHTSLSLSLQSIHSLRGARICCIFDKIKREREREQKGGSGVDWLVKGMGEDEDVVEERCSAGKEQGKGVKYEVTQWTDAFIFSLSLSLSLSL